MVEQFIRYSADTIGHMDRTTDGQTDKMIPEWGAAGGIKKREENKNYLSTLFFFALCYLKHRCFSI